MGEINIYRVRKTFNDIKSQKGAFLLFEAAVKCAEREGLNVFDNKGKILYGGGENTRHSEEQSDKESRYG